MTPIRRLINALKDPDETLSPAIVEEIDSQYPFFTLADAILLQRSGGTLHPDTRRRLSERLAVNASNPRALFTLIDPAHNDWANFYPDDDKTQQTPSTEDAISTFLETYGHSDPASDALLEKLIFNPPAPDYLSLLANEEDPALDELDSPDPLFPSLQGLEQLPPPVPADDIPADDTADSDSDTNPETTSGTPAADTLSPQPAPDRPGDDSSLQESLAKIYIRRRRYDKAFEIINSLSLNNSKKSIYFADQLRFLRKLMLNQQKSNE